MLDAVIKSLGKLGLTDAAIQAQGWRVKVVKRQRSLEAAKEE
jgi:hypothetical protein